MAYTTQYFIEDQGKRKEKDQKQYSMQLDKQVSKQKIRDLAASCCTLSRAEKVKRLKLAVTSGRPRRYVQGWLPDYQWCGGIQAASCLLLDDIE